MEEYVPNPPNQQKLSVQRSSSLLNKAADSLGDQVPGPVLPTDSREVLMTEWDTELNKSGKEIVGNSAPNIWTSIVASCHGSPVPIRTMRPPELHRGVASMNYRQKIATVGDFIEEPGNNQAITEGRIQPTSDYYQEQSSNGMDRNAEGLLADRLEAEAPTDSVDHLLQHSEQQNQLPDIMESIEMSSNNTSSESDSDSSSGGEPDKELGKYFYPSLEEIENARAPEVGMRFPTLEDAHRFYNTHALLAGFKAIRGTNYKKQKYVIECNLSRKSKLRENLKRKRKKNILNRTQCQAKVIVKLVDGQWEFTTCRNEHNHPLWPRPSLTSFFFNHKYMSTEDKTFLRVLQQSRISPKKAMKVFKKMRGSGNIAFIQKDLSILPYTDQRRKVNSDVETTLNHFQELQLRNPCFSYTTQTDEDNRVRSIFWTDARSRMDYEIFGDFISFDTTYSTNRHNMPFTPIIGINNHGRTLVLGCALLQDQKAETFKWMFQTFLQVMGGTMPRVIITDHDEAMTNAISEVMPQVRHRFCKCNVMKNAREKLGVLMAARGDINAELHDLVDNSLTEMEFEEGWAALIERYDASENEHLQLMWQTRKNWVPAYFREDFCPFIGSTELSKGTNSLFKDYVLPKDRIEKFIEQYEKIQEKMIKMDDEDRLQSGTEPSCFSLQPIEKHAAHIYTRQIFLKVQRELLHSTAFNVEEIESEAVYRLEKVFNYEKPEFNRNSFEVLVELGTNTFKCQCAKFTRDGILCCHIFRLFTQFGINEIPGEYIVPRWSPKFREEQLKQYKEKCLEKHDENHSDDTMRYAMLMSKVSGIGKEICGDGTKCNRFMLELDKIQEKLATTTEQNPENDDS